MIDYARELKRDRVGAATHFLQKHFSQPKRFSVIARIEFLEGFPDTAEGLKLLSLFDTVLVDPGIAERAAEVRRRLRFQGRPIGDFDVVIAATALTLQEPLVTRNRRHFERIEGLTVLDYSNSPAG